MERASNFYPLRTDSLGREKGNSEWAKRRARINNLEEIPGILNLQKDGISVKWHQNQNIFSKEHLHKLNSTCFKSW